MADSIQILPPIVKVRLEVPQVSARIVSTQIPVDVEDNADAIEVLPEVVKILIEVPRVSAKVEIPEVHSAIDTNDIPVVLVPGKVGPAGRDGAVIGGAAIDDGAPVTNRVWSSQHTHDEDVAVVDSLTPGIDLVLLFNNALA